MKVFRRVGTTACLLVVLAGAAFATAYTSTVDPTVPATNSPLSSASMRAQFAKVITDINALGAQIAAAAGITALTGDVTASCVGSCVATLANTTTARNDIGLGAAAAPTFAGLTLNGAGIVAPNAPTISTSTFTPNFAASNHFIFTLTCAPCTIAAPTNLVAGQTGVIELAQDGTGSRTVTWNSVFKFAGATAPTLSTGASKSDFFGYYVKDATHIILGSGVLDAR